MIAKPRAATLKQVAQAAGVSLATVSRFLNGSLDLPRETAERVTQAIRTLDYKPNPHARSLSRGQTDTIGLVVPDIANPFFARLAAAVEAAADTAGLGLVLAATLNRTHRELDSIERFWRSRVDGLLFVTNHADDGSLAEAINKVGSVVLLDEDVAGAKVPKIFCENEAGGYLATQHLIEAGHRGIAFIGGPVGLFSSTERHRGFARALLEAGLSGATIQLNGAYTVEHGRAAMAAILAAARRPTAVFASSDEIATGCLEVIRDAGLRIPEDLSIVGFDDVGPLHLFEPPLTAVRQPVELLGRRAVELVLAQTLGEAPTEVERLPVELVVRSSVAAPAARAPSTIRRGRRTANAKTAH
jgi:LacI family transcriptional regulator